MCLFSWRSTITTNRVELVVGADEDDRCLLSGGTTAVHDSREGRGAYPIVDSSTRMADRSKHKTANGWAWLKPYTNRDETWTRSPARTLGRRDLMLRCVGGPGVQSG